MDGKYNGWDMWKPFERQEVGRIAGLLQILAVMAAALLLFAFANSIPAFLLTTGCVLSGAFFTHAVWCAVCKKHGRQPNRHFRGAAKTTAAYLVFVGVIAVWGMFDKNVSWPVLCETNAALFIVMLGCFAATAVLYQVAAGVAERRRAAR